ncbi:MAG TPA: N-acetylmuramoyl-L-alanine amidase [Bacteroidota bacterium]|nr:N-acetylmuramoyl-L-alanine amidase [Bacteroidota bacterium]
MRFHAARTYAALVLGSVALLASDAARAQQNAVRIEFAGDSSRTTVIGAFRRGGTLYASLSDLAQVFSLATFENTQTHKLEVKRPPLRLKVAGANPFVIITDEQDHRSVTQLPQEVVYAANAYFVPLDAFLPLLRPAFGINASFNPWTGVLGIGTPSAASVFDITGIQLEPKANGMLIRILASKKLTDYESWMRADNWLYLTVGDARADTTAINAVAPEGLVKQIITIQSPTAVQLTFRLSGKIATSEIVPDDSSNDLLLSVRTKGPQEGPPPVRKDHEIPANLEGQRKASELDVIVLDAGHGGYDPGTIGVTGVKEKTVSLGIVLKLGALITKYLPGVKVVYTRKDDRFVELDKRGKIANEAGGKLFISVHCNSLPRKPSITRGFEVYLLRPGRSEDAIAIAERENSVIEMEEGSPERYQKLTEENFILVAMAQSAHVKASEVFADLTQKEMATRTSIPNRGVKQAGFYVLVGAAMPNVLIETAYLSNREDERILRSDTGQQKIAEALLRAIRKYKEEYEKLLEEGKEIGAAQ